MLAGNPSEASYLSLSMFSWLTEQFLGDDTRHWPEHRRTPLTLDLSRQALNGVRLGEPVDRLRNFGRPDNQRPRRAGYFSYPASGFSVIVDNGARVHEFAVALVTDPTEPRLTPAASLSLILGSRSVEIRPGSQLAEVVDQLAVRGDTEHRFTEGLRTAEFEVADCRCEFECGADGSIGWIDFGKQHFPE